MTAPMAYRPPHPPFDRPGWYPCPSGNASLLRWWTGRDWGADTMLRPGSVGAQLRVAGGIAACALGLLGAAVASLTDVSLLSGMGTVWFGVVLAAIGGIVAFVVPRVDVAVRIVACLLFVGAVSAAVYDEVQLHHKRQEISHILDN